MFPADDSSWSTVPFTYSDASGGSEVQIFESQSWHYIGTVYVAPNDTPRICRIKGIIRLPNSDQRAKTEADTDLKDVFETL